MHGFQLKFYCVRWFRFLHGFVLDWESLLFPLYSLHFQGQVQRTDLEEEALRRNRPIRQRAWDLADWTILLTDAPAHLLSFQEALVLLLRERWQMEMLYKLCKQYGWIDEWHTANRWRILCELYAKLIGLLLQHWLIILFAWQDEQRSLVKLAQVIRDSACSLLEALAGSARFARFSKASSAVCDPGVT